MAQTWQTRLEQAIRQRAVEQPCLGDEVRILDSGLMIRKLPLKGRCGCVPLVFETTPGGPWRTAIETCPVHLSMIQRSSDRAMARAREEQDALAPV